MTCSSPWVKQRSPKMAVLPSKPNNATNLSLGEDWEEEILNGIVGGPSADPDQKSDSIESARLAKDGDDGLVQSADSEWSIHSLSNFSAE